MKKFSEMPLIKILSIVTAIFLCAGCSSEPVTGPPVFTIPKGYYDPLYKSEKIVISNGKEASFSFKPDRYEDYRIFLGRPNEAKGSYHLSEDIRSTTTCTSIKEFRPKIPGTDTYVEGAFSSYRKDFFEKATLLRLSGLDEERKETQRRHFFVLNSHYLMSVAVFDKGDWTSGWAFDDIGREYTCTVRFIMGKDDYLESSVAVRRGGK